MTVRYRIVGYFLVLSMVGLFLVIPSIVLASSCSTSTATDGEDYYVKQPKTPYNLEQPFANKTTIDDASQYVNLMYSFAAGLGGIIAVVLIMFGGMQWILAAGNDQKISSAKEIITSAVTGLLILLLSYWILYFINPRLTELGFEALEIPIQESCPEVILETIPNIDGLQGNGKQGCPAMVRALKDVVAEMRKSGGKCETCTIGLSSGYRTAESQLALRACYEKAVDEGYRDSKGRELKPGCPAGCGSCNFAGCVNCKSGHLRGAAVDVWLEGVTDPTKAASSKGKLTAGCNNGACESDSADKDKLKANQELLKDIMTATGKFSPYTVTSDGAGEWWHFNFNNYSRCDDGAESKCDWYSVSGSWTSDASENAYCEANAPVSSTGKYYQMAKCDKTTGTATCNGTFGGYTWSLVMNGACDDTTYTNKTYEWDSSTKVTSPLYTYTAPPTCKSTTVTTGSSCPFLSVYNSDKYILDNNILPQVYNELGVQVVKDVYKLNNELINNKGVYSLKLSEWESEVTKLDAIKLWQIKKLTNYQTGLYNDKFVYYKHSANISTCEFNGYNCLNRLLNENDDVYGITGDEAVISFKDIKDLDSKALIVNAKGRDRYVRKDEMLESSNKFIDYVFGLISTKALAKVAYSIHLDYLNSSNEWIEFDQLHPREFTSLSHLIDLSNIEIIGNELTIRLRWTANHDVNSIEMVEINDDNVTTEELIMLKANHSVVGDLINTLSIVDDNFASLSPGEYIKLEFEPTKEKGNFDYYFESTGYYYTIE